MRTRSPAPAVLVSLALHAGAWALMPRGGSAVLGPPGEPMPPLVWVDVAEVLAMPGTGNDLLAGPGSSRGGAEMPLAGGLPSRGGRAAPSVAPGPSDPGEADPSVTGGSEPLDATVLDALLGGIPVATEGDPGGSRDPSEARDAAIRELTLDALVEGGMVGSGLPGFGDGTEPGAGGAFYGMGHRRGTTTDPEILLWQLEVRRRLRAEFHPLPSLRTSHPELAVRVRVVIDPASGRIVKRSLAVTSGIRSFDRAALAAVDSVGQLPAVPEAWRDTLAAGFELRFTHDL